MSKRPLEIADSEGEEEDFDFEQETSSNTVEPALLGSAEFCTINIDDQKKHKDCKALSNLIVPGVSKKNDVSPNSILETDELLCTSQPHQLPCSAQSKLQSSISSVTEKDVKPEFESYLSVPSLLSPTKTQKPKENTLKDVPPSIETPVSGKAISSDSLYDSQLSFSFVYSDCSKSSNKSMLSSAEELGELFLISNDTNSQAARPSTLTFLPTCKASSTQSQQIQEFSYISMTEKTPSNRTKGESFQTQLKESTVANTMPNTGRHSLMCKNEISPSTKAQDGNNKLGTLLEPLTYSEKDDKLPVLSRSSSTVKPAVRVGLSKIRRVDSLHSYLKKM